MRATVSMLICAWLAACAGQGVGGHESHRSAVNDSKIDYPYWDLYLLQHGEAETLQHFDAVLDETPVAEQDALIDSFERFCRFQGCLDGYRAKKAAEPPN